VTGTVRSRLCSSDRPETMHKTATSSPANGTVYASTIQARPWPEGARSSPMDGSATLTTVTSKRFDTDRNEGRRRAVKLSWPPVPGTSSADRRAA